MNINPKSKTIVCYGNSNTWGRVPNTNERYPANKRWVGVLQNSLGDGYKVVNEGLCGRTFVAEDLNNPHITGITQLESILLTNDPIAMVVVMLGTNDLKDTYGLSVKAIAGHLRQTVQFIQKESGKPSPTILIICPPPVVNPDNRDIDERLKDAPKISHLLAPLYMQVSKEFDCPYLNAGDFISLENTDGYHLDVEHHKVLGEKVAATIVSEV